MNAKGELDYVSYKGIEQFKNYKDLDGNHIENGYDGRKRAMKPGNRYGKMMGCTRLPAVIIGSNIFVHAGIVDGLLEKIGIDYKNTEKENKIKDAREKLEQINRKIRQWLLGTVDESSVDYITNRSADSMFWTRLLGNIPPGVDLSNIACTNNIKNVLEVFDINNIIVGHTPQSFKYSEKINSTCSGKVWRVDKGSSKAFNEFDAKYKENNEMNENRRTQYLEILNDTQYKICNADECSI